MRPLLSICIPTYNRANKLSRLLMTLKAELFLLNLDSKIQIIVSDNASTDDTYRMMSSYVAANPNITYIRQPTNLGFDGNVRFLYQQAETDYVWFFSDDDMPLPEALPIILKGLQEHNPDVLLFSFIQPPGSKYRTFNFPEAYTIIEEPRLMIELVSRWPKISMYILRKVLFDFQQTKELEPFHSNGYFFVSLAFSVLFASKKPKLCIISKPLAVCDTDYIKFDFDPKCYLEWYKIFYHPFVVQCAPKLAKKELPLSYRKIIYMLFEVKMGTFIVSGQKLYNEAINNTPIYLWLLREDSSLFLKLIIMKMRLTKLYKRIRSVWRLLRWIMLHPRRVIKRIVVLMWHIITLQKRPAKVQYNDGTISKHVIKQYLPENPIVVEAGAHIGTDTVEMSRLWPKGTVYAFEPVPGLFQRLWENTYQLENVCRYSFALGNKTRTAKMYISSGTSDGSSSLLAPKEHLTFYPGVTFQSHIEVKVMSLDEWAEKQNLNRVDFLWLDVQGYELVVLKGMVHLLKTV
ncbi:MAG: FkbM family methyltransferase, partial [Candidatus Omnitrophica bacterium]|nr:FkbM family methyltransferase [Candidatus Omnitrophota bacterium]